jgi:uncharacterized protein YndB with AHSA1/START domain
MENENTKDREIILSRVINAPRQLVWQVWTSPEHLDKWWGPNGFKNETHSIEFKEGGTWLYTMHGPDNADFPNKIVYSKINEPALLQYHHTDGKEQPEIAFDVTVTFEEIGANKTKVTQRTVMQTAEMLRIVVEQFGAIEGGKQHLGNLDVYTMNLQGIKNFTVTREIDAPIQLVWDSLTKAEHLKHWWGPVGLEMSHTTVDLRPGGLFHYGMKAPDGNMMWGKFTYREIEEPNRLVFTNSFSDADGGTTRAPFPGLVWPLEVLNELTLTEHNGKTILTLSGYPVNSTQEEEQNFSGMFGSMQQGFGSTFDQLDVYIITLKNNG